MAPTMLKRRAGQMALQYVRNRIQKRPLVMNLEVTGRCNARCDFCNVWRLERPAELDDYLPVIEKVRPMVVCMVGGEPLLRQDLPDLVERIKSHAEPVYVCVITNGALLSVPKALALRDAGLDRLCVSLDFLGPRHDSYRKVPGLFSHLSELIPRLSEVGLPKVALNTIVMADNLDHLEAIAHQAHAWEADVSYSAYGAVKAGNSDHTVTPADLDRLDHVIQRLVVLKRQLGNIRNAEAYLRSIPAYFRGSGFGGCQAGTRHLCVTADGYVKPCHEMPPVCHYTDYTPGIVTVNGCAACWYACRAESEAPFSIRPAVDLARMHISGRRNGFSHRYDLQQERKGVVSHVNA